MASLSRRFKRLSPSREGPPPLSATFGGLYDTAKTARLPSTAPTARLPDRQTACRLPDRLRPDRLTADRHSAYRLRLPDRLTIRAVRAIRKGG